MVNLKNNGVIVNVNTSVKHLGSIVPVDVYAKIAGSYLAANVSLVFPLDEAGTLPLAAYGNARLTAAYSGPCWRVVRPSDSAELDIGFDGQWVDEAALSAFLGSETGRLRTKYDLTGNGLHIDQADNTKRPYILPDLRLGAGICPSWYLSDFTLPAGISLDKRNAEFLGVFEHSIPVQASPFEIGSVANAHMGILNGATGIITPRPAASPSHRTQSKPVWTSLSSSASGVIYDQDGEVATGAATTSSVASGGYLGRLISTGYNLRGFYGMAAFYARPLSVAERAAAKAAADTLWGCVSTGNVLIVAGDSIGASSSVGTYADSPVRNILRALTSKPKCFNFSGGGNRLNLILPAYATSEQAIFTKYPGQKTVAWLQAGTNDMGVSGRAPADVYADAQTYCGNIRANGGKVVISTLLPRTSYGVSTLANFDIYNTLVRTNWASFADGFVDLNTHPVMGAVGAPSNATLYLDGLHPTGYGNRLLAEAVTPEINRVFALP